MSYAAFADRVNHLAHGLRHRGVCAGDRVAFLGPNRPEFLECLFAAGALGAVFVPINFRLTAPEIDHVLTDSGSSVLVHSEEHGDVVAELTRANRVDLIALGRSGDRGSEYEQLLVPEGSELLDEPVSLEDLCVIMYTSGSTGRPKGAMLTHGNLTWNCVNVLVESDLTGDEVALVVAPLFHAAALGMSCLPTLLKGGAVVLETSFRPDSVFDVIEKYRVTSMFGVPAMFDALSAHPKWNSADLSSLRMLNCGGSPVPAGTIHRYLERGLGFVQGYGMTEAAPGVAVLDQQHAQDKLGSAGVPSFFTDVRVIDADGKEVGAGERGEVVVQGPNVMRGYWGKPDETASVIRDGWLHSGDVAAVDSEGYLFVLDRIKDMIISGGENIYPAEVENELYSYGGIEACAVIGIPDEKWGEVGKALVQPSPGVVLEADAVIAFLRSRLAGYKVPKAVEIVDSLPRTGSGKLLKSRIREQHGMP